MDPERGDLTPGQVIDMMFRDPSVRHGLTDFADLGPIEDILQISKAAVVKNGVIETKYYVRCLKRERDIQIWSPSKSNPEEIVRQLWLYKLTTEYDYPMDDIAVEYKVSFGSSVAKKPADIVVFEHQSRTAKIILEVKKPKRSDGLAQLKSYLNAEGSPVGCWSNGVDRILLYRPYPRDFDDTLTDLPRWRQEPADVLRGVLTLDDLRTSFDFKGIIQDLEELVLANSGVDEFNEIFKIIFAKLYDEMAAQDLRRDRRVYFRKNSNEAVTQQTINRLFGEARNEWPGIFDESEDIKLTRQHLQVVVGPLERVRLLGASMRVMDDAFEYLMPNVAKKKNGQFFTPRYVIDMCVKMLDPGERDYVLDPACGSAGFLIHTMDYVWPAADSSERARRKSAYASKYLWGIDFDERSAKVARALMLIAGDGRTRVFKANSLDPREWPDTEEGRELIHALRESRLLAESVPGNVDISADMAWDCLRNLKFDVILTNPPFAGEIRDSDLLSHYRLASRALTRKNSKEERDVLFVERVLDMLRPGGRAAVILPQGKFNNLTLAYVRNFLADRARILAVVGLHPNTFKPHTGTKTSVVFFQKYTKDEAQARHQARIQAEAEAPDFRQELLSLADSVTSGETSAVDLPEYVDALLAEYYGEEQSEDESDGRPSDSAESSESDEDPLQLAYESARDAVARAEEEVRLASATGKKRAMRSAESTLRRAVREYDKRRSELLGRSLSGRLTLLAEDEDAIKALQEKFALEKISNQFDYEVFLAVSQHGGKNSSGDYIVRLERDGSLSVDSSGGYIIDQDCVTYREEDPPGIAEAYLAWRDERI